MSIHVIDFKKMEMTSEEFDYYNQLVESFTSGHYSGKEQFHDMFDVDSDGCITIIRPPIGKEVGWAILVFLQNLMINQRLRRVEKWVRSLKDERSTNV
jgi:hypothetical protein